MISVKQVYSALGLILLSVGQVIRQLNAIYTQAK